MALGRGLGAEGAVQRLLLRDDVEGFCQKSKERRIQLQRRKENCVCVCLHKDTNSAVKQREASSAIPIFCI